MACALALKVVVPAGYMPTFDHGRVSLQICSGMTSASAEPMAMAGMHHGKQDRGEHGKAEQPCAFAGIAAAALGSADLALLLAAIAFSFLLAARAIAQILPAPPGHLRPPLRAPPAIT